MAKADLVLTVSGTSLRDIVKVCGVPKERIEVVYNDVAEIYKEAPHPTFVKEVLGRFSLEAGKYFLYVGGYDLRKNVDGLLKEFENYSGDEPLVLAGGKVLGGGLYKSYDIKSLGSVVRTGFLAAEELAVLYRNCAAFVNLSTMEGFNLPIVEAANCGAPLVLSDIAVHREVAEDAAVFVREGGLVAGLSRVLTEREKYVSAAKKLAKRYNWEKYAKLVKKFLTDK